MGWNDGPSTWGEMQRVLTSKPRRAGSRLPEPTGDGGDSPAWSRKRGSYERPDDHARTGSSIPYAELHAHSAYSFLDGASTPEELVEEAARLNLRAIALTDHDGLYGVVRFAEAARELDVQTVFGAELSLGNVARTEVPDPPGPHLLVLARGPEGYRRLSRELAKAHLAGGEKGKPRYDFDALTEAAGGHWHVLTGCRKGHVRQALSTGGPEAAEAALADLVDRFGRRPGRASSSPTTVTPSTTSATPCSPRWRRGSASSVVATTAAHFAEPARGRLAMAMGAIRARNSMDEAAGWLAPLGGSHLRSGDEMARLFAQHPGAVSAAADLGEQCAFGLALIAPKLPPFDVPAGAHRGQLAAAPGDDRCPQPLRPTGARRAGLRPDRARAESHRPARTSPATSWWCTTSPGSARTTTSSARAGDRRPTPRSATRWASPTSTRSPTSCCSSGSCHRRATARRTSTSTSNRTCARRRFSTSTSATAATTPPRSPTSSPIAAAARCATWPGRWASPRGSRTPGASRSAGGTGSPTHPTSRTIPEQVIDLALQIKDLPRHMGIHSGGMVICDRPIADVCPVEWARMENRSVLQWDKDDCAAIGLVKFDLLGLGMLSALHYAIDLIAEHKGIEVDLSKLDLSEAAVYEMLQRADSVGVFQVESRAQMATLPRLKPRVFYDLVVEVALIRPGPIQGGSVHPYIRRRNGEEEVTYDHPSMEQALRKTLGIPLFQEQLMQLAVDCAGFSAAEADQLRRAMGSKRSTEKMKRLRGRFYDGMRERHGITGEVADRIYEKLEAFANFGFPESHSLSFASLVFYSSWFKLHHPAVFCAALLRAQPMGFYSPQSLVADARRHGVLVHGPDVERQPGPRHAGEPRPRGAAGSRRGPPHRRRVGRADRRRPKGARRVHVSGRPGGPGAALRAADRGAGHRGCARLLRDHPAGGAVGGGRRGLRTSGPAARCRVLVARPVPAGHDRARVDRRRRLGHRRLTGQSSRPVPARTPRRAWASSPPIGCCRCRTAPGCSSRAR